MESTVRNLARIVLAPGFAENNSLGSSAVNEELIRVLLGLKAPAWSPAQAPLQFFDKTLNDSQKAAVAFALDAEQVACIHGPPGVSCNSTEFGCG